MSYAYLIKVEANENNNKFYEMKDNGDGTFTAYYGRVGRTPQSMTYAMALWNKKYNEKLGYRKGYTDITHLKAKEHQDTTTKKDLIDTDSRVIKDIFNYLLTYTKENVSRNYLTPVAGVTQAMVDEAQSIIDHLVQLRDNQEWIKFNSSLQQLYMVIPRQMGNVRDYILDLNRHDILNRDSGRIVQNEQDTLDALKGQIVVVHQEVENNTISLFDTMGIIVEDINLSDEQRIKRALSDISNKYYQAVRITNKRTEERYTKWLAAQSNQTTMDLWHGSRSQNWVSLLQKGLLLNPVGVITTGKMFGYGLYFAPRAKKSLGYTSLENSYWTRGNDMRGYMGLFEVHTGNMIKYQSSQGHLTYEKVSRMGYNSVMGEKGYSLYNDEIIVYNEAQTNIKYLVELR